MFLKRIELSGFKSFADRTELEFVKGITAVVGPNGSGKSNISDSIRWVLGEQSAKSLRGGKMEDIIFAGSDSRKAVNYGEVTLTLDNSDRALPLDFTEVSVTRRLHRSGESEYYINKQACRLKDITELFMDTGVGREAYSIIGQGKIEEILSTRSEDRRGIFEEASGIVKFKTRKREAQKKLDDTEQNLLRIGDLIAEIEDQIEPMRLQSEKAREYKELREMLKQKEIALYVHQIEEVHAAWQEIGEQLKRLERQQLELSAAIGVQDAELEQHRLEVRRLEDEIERLQGELLRLSEEAEKCEGQGEVLRERQRNLTANRDQLLAAMDSLHARRQALQGEWEGIRDQAEKLDALVRELRERLAEEEQRFAGVAVETSNETEERLKNDLLDVLNRLSQARNESRFVEEQREAVRRRTERIAEELEELAPLEAEQKAAMARCAAELESVRARIEQTMSRFLENGEAIQRRRQEIAELSEIARKWEQKVEALTSRRETMQELKDDYDGFMHGVKAVLTARGRSGNGSLRGVHGAVAELIKVPEQYEVALETTLGAALQHVVMDDEASARAAIAFLKQRQAGRATFLPLTVIRGRSIGAAERETLERMDGFIGIAVDLIEFDPQYKEIMSSLLGQVIVARSLEEANRIAAKGGYRYRVVTLDGDLVNAGGSMTGGSLMRKNANLLGRQRQIDELDAQIRQANVQLDSVRGKLAELKADEEALVRLSEQLRSQGEHGRMEEQRLLAENRRLETEAKHTAQQRAALEQEREAAARELDELAARKTELAERIVGMEAEEARLRESIRQAESNRKAHESEKDKLLSGLTDLKVQAASADRDRQAAEDRRLRIEADIREVEAEMERQEEARTAIEAEIETNRREAVQAAELLNELKIKRQACSEQLDFRRAERMEKVRYIESEEAKTKEERTRLKQVEEQLRLAEVRVNRLDVELEGLLRKLSEEYELSFELAKARYPVPDDIPGAQQIVKDLKRRIAALGEVNLGAIEEYERLRERFDFLSSQHHDLLEAKKSLYDVIKEMDDEMAKRFTATFEEIRSYFGRVFTRLFGGGRADLLLSDPKNPLETGVEIVAQPPGKKLQNLQLLSGGERALTAIALLFAILHVKPVPFCVLDEVEAALDEANVSRFAEYLREFSEQTQFIVVTHRKGTMEEADVLYGVAMEEGGVSKLVSVKLEDEEPASA
jgi:chromosome segregation protein